MRRLTLRMFRVTRLSDDSLDGYGRRRSDIVLAEIPEIVAGMIDKM